MDMLLNCKNVGGKITHLRPQTLYLLLMHIIILYILMDILAIQTNMVILCVYVAKSYYSCTYHTLANNGVGVYPIRFDCLGIL